MMSSIFPFDAATNRFRLLNGNRSAAEQGVDGIFNIFFVGAAGISGVVVDGSDIGNNKIG